MPTSRPAASHAVGGRLWPAQLAPLALDEGCDERRRYGWPASKRASLGVARSGGIGANGRPQTFSSTTTEICRLRLLLIRSVPLAVARVGQRMTRGLTLMAPIVVSKSSLAPV